MGVSYCTRQRTIKCNVWKIPKFPKHAYKIGRRAIRDECSEVGSERNYNEKGKQGRRRGGGEQKNKEINGEEDERETKRGSNGKKRHEKGRESMEEIDQGSEKRGERRDSGERKEEKHEVRDSGEDIHGRSDEEAECQRKSVEEREINMPDQLHMHILPSARVAVQTVKISSI